MEKKREIKSTKRNAKKEKSELKEFEKDFIAFGNRKRVFWSITIATIIISLIGIPIMIKDQTFFKRFLVIWILEILYIAMWIKWGQSKHWKWKKMD